MSQSTYLSAAEIRGALSLRDLTDPASGAGEPHAMQEILHGLVKALETAWGAPGTILREVGVVSVQDNYDRLLYDPEAAARNRRYTRYLSPGIMLRSHTSAGVHRGLKGLEGRDGLLILPGLVYRRDVIDRLHVGEPHQVDLWRVSHGPTMTRAHLLEMIDLVVRAALPGCAWRVNEAQHPYTVDGLEIEAEVSGRGWVEIGECGLAHPRVLEEGGHPGATGLAMGLGLDRLVMLRKGIGDIRLLRSTDERIAGQMRDLAPYKEVSRQPSLRRDLSVVVSADLLDEELGDQVRTALGTKAAWVEEIVVLSRTEAGKLPPQAVTRLGINPEQVNVLLRVVLRHTDRTLTAEEANVLRDDIYAAVHKGTVWDWCVRHKSAQSG
jgi:phenylalanyl-tRNA synthetase alpha chain